jgi:hypothetical protein
MKMLMTSSPSGQHGQSIELVAEQDDKTGNAKTGIAVESHETNRLLGWQIAFAMSWQPSISRAHRSWPAAMACCSKRIQEEWT